MLGSLFESVDKKIEMICKETKNVKQLRALLKRNKNVNINMLDFDGWSIVHLAVIGGSAEIIEFLIKETNANPMKKCNDNMVTPLHTAAWRGSHEIVRVLLTHSDVKINELSKDGQTALHYAAWSGMIHACRTLLVNNADTLIRNNDGFTPLLIAARCNQIAVFSVLLEAALALKTSTTFNDSDNDDQSYSLHPVNDPIHSDANGCFALHHACYEGHDELVRYLLQLGADKTQPDNLGRTPLDMCVNDSTRRIVEGPVEEETTNGPAPSVPSVKTDAAQAARTPPRAIGSQAASTFRDKHSRQQRLGQPDMNDNIDDREESHKPANDESHTAETESNQAEVSVRNHASETTEVESTGTTADPPEHDVQPVPEEVPLTAVIGAEEYLQAANALHAKEIVSMVWDLCSALSPLSITPTDGDGSGSLQTATSLILSDQSRAQQLQALLTERPTLPLNSLRDSNYQTLLMKTCGRQGNPSATPVILAYRQHVSPAPITTTADCHAVAGEQIQESGVAHIESAEMIAGNTSGSAALGVDNTASTDVLASFDNSAADPPTEVSPNQQQAKLVVPCDIFATDSHNRTALQHAVMCGNNPAISLLLSHMSKDSNSSELVRYIQHRNDQGCNAIHLACEYGHLESLKLILGMAAEASSGAQSTVNINAKDRDGFTPLHYACKYSHLAVVRFLVTETKAQIMAFNLSGELPADVTKNSLIVRFLQTATQYRASLNPATVSTVHAKIKAKGAHDEALGSLSVAIDALKAIETTVNDPKKTVSEPTGASSKRPALQRARTFTRDTSPFKSVRAFSKGSASESTPPQQSVLSDISAIGSAEPAALEAPEYPGSSVDQKKQSIYAFPSVVIRGSNGEVMAKQGQSTAMDKFMNLGATTVDDGRSETDSSCCEIPRGKEVGIHVQCLASQSPDVAKIARALSPIQQRDAKMLHAQPLSERSSIITSRADPRDSSAVFKELYKSMIMEAKHELLGKGAPKVVTQKSAVAAATPASIRDTTPVTAASKQSTRSQSNPTMRRPPVERSTSTSRSVVRPAVPAAAVCPTKAQPVNKKSQPVKQSTAPASPQKELMERMRVRERQRHSFSSTVPLSKISKSAANNPNNLYSKQLGQQESVFTRLSTRPAAVVAPGVVETKGQTKRPAVSKKASAEETRLVGHLKSIDRAQTQPCQQHQRLAEHNRTYSIDNQDGNVVLNTSYLASAINDSDQPAGTVANTSTPSNVVAAESSSSKVVPAIDGLEKAPLRRRSSLSMFASMFPVFGGSSANLPSPTSNSQMVKKAPLPVQGYTQQSLLSDSPLNTEYVELQVFIGTLNRILDLHMNGLKKLFYRWKHYRGDNINDIMNSRMTHVSPLTSGRNNNAGKNGRKLLKSNGISSQSQRDLYDDSHVVRATVSAPTSAHTTSTAPRGMTPKQRQLLWPNADEPPPPPPPPNKTASPQGLSVDPMQASPPQHHPEGSPWHTSISDLSSSTTPEQPSSSKRACNANERLVSGRIRSVISTPQEQRVPRSSESIQRLLVAMEPLVTANESALRTIYNHFSSDKRPLKPTKHLQQSPPTDRPRMTEYDLWTLLMTFTICPDVCSRSQLSDLVQYVCTRADGQTPPTQTAPSFRRRSSVTPTRRSSVSGAPSTAGPMSRRSSVSVALAGNDEVDNETCISFNSFIKILCLLSELCYSAGRQNPAGADAEDPLKQFAMLLYLMDSSDGRHRIASGASRTAKVIPAFTYTGALISSVSGNGKR